MDHHKFHVSMNTPEKPSKIIALCALVFAFALPFILVKTFPQKQKTRFTNHIQQLPNPTPVNTHLNVPTNETKPTTPPSAQSASRPDAKPIIKTTPTRVMPPQPTNPKITIKTRPGDTLTSVFNRAGLSTTLVQKILHETPQAKLLTKIRVGDQFHFLIKNKQLIRLQLPFNSTQYLVLSRERDKYKVKIHSRKTNNRIQFLTATMHGSLYNTAKRNNIPSKLIDQMTKIFTWDINFSKDIKDGDQITIIYDKLFIKDKPVGIGDIRAVSYRNQGQNFQAVRYTNRAGHTDYFSPTGASLKKAFDRYPLRFSHISSTFSLSRYHPILHYARPHKGVDLAAPIGTPIHATSDGRIEIIGRQGAYGNMIKIKHNDTYSTVYGHLLKFQKGLSRGSYVRIGQVIGYVGQSGLADGPHCHYEFHIKSQPKNPTTVVLPRGQSLGGRDLALFKSSTHSLLAQMQMAEHNRFASASRKYK